MKNIVVTEAVEGLGLDIVKKVLKEYSDTFIFLGYTNPEQGKELLKNVISEFDESIKSRLQLLEIDITSDDSVKKAVETIKLSIEENPKVLHGLVYNENRKSDVTSSENKTGNAYNFYRVTKAFQPLMGETGNI